MLTADEISNITQEQLDVEKSDFFKHGGTIVILPPGGKANRFTAMPRTNTYYTDRDEITGGKVHKAVGA